MSAIDLSRFLNGDIQDRTRRPSLDLVIAGGESGPRARPMHGDWILSLRDQCRAANVPFFFKQWGEWLPMRDGSAKRTGKKRAGRLLDGLEHNELPE